jgi:uncharacterized LabA/DUF88 family protein
MPFRTNVYVDAFNVYYGSTKDTPYRWLNLARLCEIMLANNVINQIKVFTGIVKPRPNDPQQPVRQQTYLRALRTIPNLTIIEGSFLTHRRNFPKAKPRRDGSLEYVEVLYTEEKGSDVNLASHLLYDAFVGDYEVAVIVSNDSDLAEPVRMVKVLLRKKVGILNPQINRPEYRNKQGNIDYSRVKFSYELRRYANFYKAITEEALRLSQFPDEMSDASGTFRKPATW